MIPRRKRVQAKAALYDGHTKRELGARDRTRPIRKSWRKEELAIGKPLELRRYLELRCIGNNVI
jgi:hypothetical protein